MMRTLILALALVVACGSDTTGPQLGDNVDVPYGTTVTMPGDTTTAKFTDVTADSRCPTGVQCVWAGEATVLFTVGGSELVTLTLGADPAKARAIVRGYQVTLVALAPYPVAGSAPVKANYVATIRFTSAKD